MIAGVIFQGYIAHLPEKRLQAIIFFGVLVLQYSAEHFYPADKKNNSAKNEGFNVLVGIVNAVLLFIPSVFLVELLSQIRLHKVSLLQQLNLPFYLNLLCTIIIMDFGMYWWHRFNHTQRFFWRFHSFHHRDAKMNTTTALRFHVVELLFSTVFKSMVFIIVGFSFLPVLIYEILFFIIIVIHHSNIKITRSFDIQYRKIFSSPLMHRIHHSNKQEETDTNYGSVFSFWDRIFDTYKKDAAGEIIFGVDEHKS